MYIISACLLGNNCKYDGGNNRNEAVLKFCGEHSYVACCPETAAGLKAPREPAERVSDRVMFRDGTDGTEYFYRGAEMCFEYARDAAEEAGEEIEGAILKKNSPSCGSDTIYDGTFSHVVTEGDGVFAEYLKAHGIKVISEDRLEIKTDD